MSKGLSLDAYIRAATQGAVHRPTGVVLEVVGLVVEVGGLRAAVADVLRVLADGGAHLDLEVIGFRGDRLLATPLGPIAGVKPGSRVEHSGRGPSIAVGFGLLGRIVDAFGGPLDGGPRPDVTTSYPVYASPPPPVSRRPIEVPFATGVRAIDGMLPLGLGQRIGIFAGAGIGKSTLLGMICRKSQADVNVIGLIGERGREVNDFVRQSLGPEGLARSVVVTATSDQPPLVRARGAETATAIAEFFRDQGKSVLLVMDSVTRYAMSLRETALATGEPPATKGYPPSVFAALPRLLERAGTAGGEGVITALYTVLVEGDDMTDPIADATRGILDGHVLLSRQLAERGHYPAIDVLQSISRLAPMVSTPEHMRGVNTLREWLATYREASDLIQVGAYVTGSDPRIDAAMRAVPRVETFLRQEVEEPCARDLTLRVLDGLARGGAN